jgi:hypothetical protein
MSSSTDLELEIAAFHQPAIDSARKMIIAAGVFYLAMPLLLFGALARLAGPSVFTTWPFLLMFGGGCAILGIHIALAHWAKRSPLPAISIALGVYVVYLGALVLYDSLGSPILPAVGLFILGRAALAGYRVHKLRAAARAG